MREYSFVNVDEARFGGIDTLFPDWQGANERVLVYSPHDDDAILGAGYAMRAAMDDGAEVHVCIVCNGNMGYSTIEEKNSIVDRRKQETRNCYERFGVPHENMIFLDFPDFSAISYIGRTLDQDGHQGHFDKSLREMRARKITRVLVPNHYHEHIDHLAAYLISAFDAPQAGDAMGIELGEPHLVKSVAQYSVWADLDPEDALVRGRNPALRANTLILANSEVEDKVCESIYEYVSQTQIIADLVQQRKSRMLSDGRMLEVFIRFDARPKLNFEPYKEFLKPFISREGM